MDAIKLDAIIQGWNLHSNKSQKTHLAQIKLLRSNIKEILLQLDPSTKSQIHSFHLVSCGCLSFCGPSIGKQGMC